MDVEKLVNVVFDDMGWGGDRNYMGIRRTIRAAINATVALMRERLDDEASRDRRDIVNKYREES